MLPRAPLTYLQEAEQRAYRRGFAHGIGLPILLALTVLSLVACSSSPLEPPCITAPQHVDTIPTPRGIPPIVVMTCGLRIVP